MKDKDFLYSDLPKNRKDVIKYLIKNRMGSIMLILLLSIPFIAPFYFWLIFSRYFYMNINETGPINFCLMNAFPNLFLVFLYGIGLSGIFYSIRRLIFSETLRIPYHFFKGIKQSGFEFGLFVTLSYIIYASFDLIDKVIYFSNSPIYYLITIIFLIFDFFLFYILFYVLSSASLYVVSFIQAIKDAFNNCFKNIKKNIFYYIISFFPLILIYFYHDNAFLIVNILGLSLLMISNVFGTLINLSNAYDLFDESINNKTYPNYYKKGLYKDEI